MKAIVLVLAAVLAGCASDPRIIEKKIPVAIGCLGDKPVRPVSKFGTGTYPGDKKAAQLALGDSIAWEGYANGLEVAMSGCDPKPK